MRPEHARLLAEVERDWAATGLHGSLLARDLRTGTEMGFGAGLSWPLASVVKLPIALVVLDAFERGDLDPAEQFDVDPAATTRGPTGLSQLRHPARLAAEDLMRLSLSVSDNAATDLLLERLGLDDVNRRLARLGCHGIVVRHPLRALHGAHHGVADIGLALATTGRTRGGGHVVPELDPNRANVGTARALLDLLARVWSDTVATPAVCARLREALGHQLTRHRLAVELVSDDVTLASKTGSFLDLRHEAGVVELADGGRFAVVALTRSEVPATEQLEADFAIGHAARLCVDALRGLE